mgnify:CR=1 FL=1
MSDTVRQKAQSAAELVEEVTAVVLPEPKDAGAIVPLAEADAPVGSEIRARMDEIDMGDYCASLPPAVDKEEQKRRRVTRFRGESMMPGLTSASRTNNKTQEQIQVVEPAASAETVSPKSDSARASAS